MRGAGGTIGTSLSQEALEIYKAKCSKTAKRPRRSACLAEKAEFAQCIGCGTKSPSPDTVEEMEEFDVHPDIYSSESSYLLLILRLLLQYQMNNGIHIYIYICTCICLFSFPQNG